MKTQILSLVVWTIFSFAKLEAAPITYEEICQRARALAAQPFQPDTNVLSEALRNLTYSEYGNIQFRPAKALWKNDGLPFEILFFHQGYVQRQQVTIYETDDRGARAVPYLPELFSYGTNRSPPGVANGFAGFRVLQANHGEFASFLGASYFRMIGSGQTFGTSARGLALDTIPLGKEEFPVFREFWIQKPSKRASEIVIFSLLDSPSVAGAFRFVIAPGNTTVATVTASLFPRREVKEFGIAPLTSMFLHDENGHPPYQDFRPEVHDSDGLLLHTSRDEWIWRPLEKKKMLRVNAYSDDNPKGFGLMQRDRNFEHYQDLVARFEARPGVWVEPRGHWGKGAVQLIQLPSDAEFSDNVVAFWVPSAPPKPGESLVLSYELHWLTNQVVPKQLGRVRATRVGEVIVEPRQGPPNLRFVVDFEGDRMESLSAKNQLQAEVHCGEGAKVVADTLLKNELNGTWRLVIEITPPSRAVDLSAFLKSQDRPITESWNYTWQP